jgi:hypothetical protein
MPEETPPSNGEIIGRMKAKIKDLARQLAARTADVTAAEAKAAKAAKDFDDAPLKAENARLQGEIRTDRHKAAFTKLAKAAGVREKAVDAVYQLSGWKAEKDQVDEAAMQTAIDGLKESADFAFEPDPGDTDTLLDASGSDRTITPSPKPVPGSGRGGAHQPSKSGIILTRDHLADPKFMLDPKNKELIQSAAAEKRIRLPNRTAQ